MGHDRCLQELEHRSALLCAGGGRCPDPLQPSLSGFTSRALGHVSVDHHKANRLFRQVVRRLDARRRQETKVTFAVFPEPLRQVLRLGRSWHLELGRAAQFVRGILHGRSPQRLRNASPRLTGPSPPLESPSKALQPSRKGVCPLRTHQPSSRRFCLDSQRYHALQKDSYTLAASTQWPPYAVLCFRANAINQSEPPHPSPIPSIPTSLALPWPSPGRLPPAPRS